MILQVLNVMTAAIQNNFYDRVHAKLFHSRADQLIAYDLVMRTHNDHRTYPKFSQKTVSWVGFVRLYTTSDVKKRLGIAQRRQDAASKILRWKCEQCLNSI